MKVGLLLSRYDNNQFAYEAINSINQYITETVEDDIILFYENITNFCVPPLCAAMTPDELCLFNDGILIANTIDGLSSITKTVNTSKKILYLSDIEWVRTRYNRNYLDNHKLLNTDVTLICRSDSHKEIMSSYCDRSDIEVMSKFDIPTIINMMRDLVNGNTRI